MSDENRYRCGDCQFFRDFGKRGIYEHSSHCRLHEVNYYANDTSKDPRKAYLSVLAHDGPCKEFVLRLGLKKQAVEDEPVPF